MDALLNPRFFIMAVLIVWMYINIRLVSYGVDHWGNERTRTTTILAIVCILISVGEFLKL